MSGDGSMEIMTDTFAPAAHVYVIGLRDGQRDLPYTKVGISGCIASRVKAMSTSMPFDIFIHASAGFDTRSDALDAESKVHTALSNLHVRGEWFAGAPSVHMYKIREVISHIERAKKEPPKTDTAPAQPQKPEPIKPKKLFKYELKMIENGIRNNQLRRIRAGDWMPKYPPIPKEDLQ